MTRYRVVKEGGMWYPQRSMFFGWHTIPEEGVLCAKSQRKAGRLLSEYLGKKAKPTNGSALS